MKSFAVVASFLLLSTAAPRAAVQTGKASIEGIVVRSGDNSPIVGAHVTLAVDEDDSADLKSIPENGFSEELALHSSLSTTTDEHGKFVLSEIDPGETYRMVISASGYVRQEYGQQIFPGNGRPIELKPGRVLKDLNVTLTPTGSIEGTVRAVSGESLQDVRIRLLRYAFNADGKRFLQMVASTTTNDVGKYRLYFLTPGRYYLHAERIDLHADYVLHTLAPFGPAFFPGESDLSHASIVDIQPGTNRSGMDFSLSGERLYRIRGQIVDGRTGLAIKTCCDQVGLFDLSPNALPGGDGGYERTFLKSTYSNNTGAFDFLDIPPGRYVIADATLANLEGGLEIVLADADVENVKLDLSSEATVSGSVRADDRVDLSEQRQVVQIAIHSTVSTDDEDDGARTAALSPKSKNVSNPTFTIRDIIPGEYRLDIRDSRLPEDSYIKEARYGGIDALNQPFQVSDGDSHKLEIVVAVSATLEGRVVNDKLMPAARKMVVLIPNLLRTRPDLYKTEVAGKDGRFEMHSIAPGDYKLFAWEDIEPYSWFDPEVIRRFETSGQPVHISESSAESVEVKVIPFRQ